MSEKLTSPLNVYIDNRCPKCGRIINGDYANHVLNCDRSKW